MQPAILMPTETESQTRFTCFPHTFQAGRVVNFPTSMPLASLDPGDCAVVDRVTATSGMAIRLMELGFVPGAVVQVIRRAPFGGPVQYRIQGVSLSMRPADASAIQVRAMADLAVAATRYAGVFPERLELAECSA